MRSTTRKLKDVEKNFLNY